MSAHTPDIDRQTILRHFEAWLDEALAAEEPPEGLAAEFLEAVHWDGSPERERLSDSYSTWEALTAATHEVRLQSRAFKELSATLRPVAELPGRVESALGDRRDALAEIERRAEARARREVIDLLLDHRERLWRGLDAAIRNVDRMRETPSPGWLQRLSPKREAMLHQALEAVAALESAYRLCLETLDDALGDMDVRELDCLDQPFDPRKMSVVQVEETNRVPEGTVADVYRRGYEWKGQVYRVAQVKVTRLPARRVAGGENE